MSLAWLVAAGLGLVTLVLAWALVRTRRSLSEARSEKRSQATRYGKLTEQFAPLVDRYPYDPEQFRFLGSPIDGVQFADDAVVLVEFKAASSRLSARQRQIRDLVEQGEVRFETVRIGDQPPSRTGLRDGQD